MQKKFSLSEQLAKELEEYKQGSVNIAGKEEKEGLRRLDKRSKGGYPFNQWAVLNLVELYYNSKFDSGNIDSEGQRKTFLNISKFRADVASKQVDIDVKDFVFVPEDEKSVWASYFANKKFKHWAKETYLGQLINEVVIDYPKFGTAVVKKVGRELERVPLLSLRNPHNCKDLNSARFVIIEHNMTIDEIKDMKGWDVSKVEKTTFDQQYTVYERYGRVPLAYLKAQNNEEYTDEDWEETVDTLSIIVENAKGKEKQKKQETIFIEEIRERPFLEVHWSKIDGRWLGVGEIENQFENQIMRNLIANMRRRGLLWATKKVFQTRADKVANNLVRDVKDGEVLKVGVNGELAQVDMGTKSLAEYGAAEQEWENNSNQKSFTFEVATGEALPSGTPFRLGVLLTNAVNTHFGLKRENLGLFWKKVTKELVVPIFKKENAKKHTMPIFASEEGFNNLKKVLGKRILRDRIFDSYLDGSVPDVEALKVSIEESLQDKEVLFGKFGDKYYDSLMADVDLVITGESIDIPKRIETLTNLYSTLAQAGDPRAEVVLGRILALTGENKDALVGVSGPAQTQLPAEVAQAFQGAGQGAGLEVAEQPSTL